MSQTSYGSQAAASIGAFVKEIAAGILRDPNCDSLEDAFRAMAFSRHGCDSFFPPIMTPFPCLAAHPGPRYVKFAFFIFGQRSCRV